MFVFKVIQICCWSRSIWSDENLPSFYKCTDSIWVDFGNQKWSCQPSCGLKANSWYNQNPIWSNRNHNWIRLPWKLIILECLFDKPRCTHLMAPKCQRPPEIWNQNHKLGFGFRFIYDRFGVFQIQLQALGPYLN